MHPDHPVVSQDRVFPPRPLRVLPRRRNYKLREAFGAYQRDVSVSSPLLLVWRKLMVVLVEVVGLAAGLLGVDRLLGRLGLVYYWESRLCPWAWAWGEEHDGHLPCHHLASVMEHHHQACLPSLAACCNIDAGYAAAAAVNDADDDAVHADPDDDPSDAVHAVDNRDDDRDHRDHHRVREVVHEHDDVEYAEHEGVHSIGCDADAADDGTDADDEMDAADDGPPDDDLRLVLGDLASSYEDYAVDADYDVDGMDAVDDVVAVDAFAESCNEVRLRLRLPLV